MSSGEPSAKSSLHTQGGLEMALDRTALREDINALYAREHVALGMEGTERMLEKASQWKLASTLEEGGVLVFPHAGVADIGHQVAAAVIASLDSGADTVIVISVLHAFTQEMDDARVRVANGADVTKEKYWGIQGTGIAGPRQEWQYDHALVSFRHFWRAETARRGILGPRVLERYPFLAGGRPEILPGIDDLAREAENAVIVSTADPFHYGIGYGTPADEALTPEGGGLELARKGIEEGISLLAAGDYWGYNQHCAEVMSDARDAGQVFRYLRGPMQGQILDLAYTDASELYHAPPPTWVAGALIQWQVQ
jgi:hypothetical protein